MLIEPNKNPTNYKIIFLVFFVCFFFWRALREDRENIFAN